MKYLSIACLALLAACGGGGGNNNQQPPGGNPPPVGIFITVHVSARTEFEPNDSLAMADAHTMPDHGADADYVGFGVEGGVHDTVDLADFFLFTASRDHVFVVQLCTGIFVCSPVSNGQLLDTSVAYFEILDQNGTLLMSSQGSISPGNTHEVQITAGLVYYVAVFPEDTVGANQDYYLELVEKDPFF